MNRPGAILVPMLAGFLLTVAVVSWRSGWWQRRATVAAPAAASVRIEVRPPDLRVVSVHLTAAQPAAVRPATVAAAPAASPPVPPEGEPEPLSEPLAPPPVPRANAGGSPDLEAPVRKFARGGRLDPD